MQILYLSNRPHVMRETWQHVRHFMPWIDRAVIVAPDDRLREFDLGPEVTVVGDTEVTGTSATTLARLDHVRRNVTLRRAVVGTDLVEDRFLLSDDDYRPIRDITPNFFTTGERDIGYFSYELAEWPGHTTDFDAAQHITYDALSYLGFPHLAYGAHMPQLMRKALWAEAFERFSTVSDDNLVCEWALYFNIAQHLHPEQFEPPRPFETMCWPQYGAEWKWWVSPPRFSFENFYPDLYAPHGLFGGLSTALDPEMATRTTFEKINRWTDFGRAADRLEFPTDIDNPWTKGSFVRRAYFAALRPARKTFGYITGTNGSPTRR